MLKVSINAAYAAGFHHSDSSGITNTAILWRISRFSSRCWNLVLFHLQPPPNLLTGKLHKQNRTDSTNTLSRRPLSPLGEAHAAGEPERVSPRAAPKGPQRRLPPCPHGPGAGAAHTSPGSGAGRGRVGACSAPPSRGLRGVPREVPARPASAACLTAGWGLYGRRARGAMLARMLRRCAGRAGLSGRRTGNRRSCYIRAAGTCRVGGFLWHWASAAEGAGRSPELGSEGDLHQLQLCFVLWSTTPGSTPVWVRAVAEAARHRLCPSGPLPSAPSLPRRSSASGWAPPADRRDAAQSPFSAICGPVPARREISLPFLASSYPLSLANKCFWEMCRSSMFGSCNIAAVFPCQFLPSTQSTSARFYRAVCYSSKHGSWLFGLSLLSSEIFIIILFCYITVRHLKSFSF